jgi:hypothetical protein
MSASSSRASMTPLLPTTAHDAYGWGHRCRCPSPDGILVHGALDEVHELGHHLWLKSLLAEPVVEAAHRGVLALRGSPRQVDGIGGHPHACPRRRHHPSRDVRSQPPPEIAAERHPSVLYLA